MSLLLDNPELCRAFKQGEQQALAQVYEHYLPLVAEIVMKGFSFSSSGKGMRFRGTSSRFMADDMIADVFVRAFRPAAREAYHGLRPYAGYLKTIARNTIIDRLRKKDPLGIMSQDIDEHENEVSAARNLPESPEGDFEQKELFSLAQKFVAGLADRERGVVQKRFFDGCSQTDAASKLGLSVPTVRKVERAVLQRFFKHMKQKGYFENLDSKHKIFALTTSVLALALLLKP